MEIATFVRRVFFMDSREFKLEICTNGFIQKRIPGLHVLDLTFDNGAVVIRSISIRENVVLEFHPRFKFGLPFIVHQRD